MTETTMTDSRAATPSVVERTRAVAAGAPVVAAHFLGRTAVLMLGEEAALMVPDKGEERRVALHSGGILSAMLQHGQRVIQLLIDRAATDDASDSAHESSGLFLTRKTRGQMLTRDGAQCPCHGLHHPDQTGTHPPRFGIETHGLRKDDADSHNYKAP